MVEDGAFTEEWGQIINDLYTPACLERLPANLPVKSGITTVYGTTGTYAEQYAKEHGLQGFVCNQLMWSLADVNFSGLADQSFVLMDQETYRYQGRAGLNAMAHMSVAKGLFYPPGGG